jgi:hypothetical protein
MIRWRLGKNNKGENLIYVETFIENATYTSVWTEETFPEIIYFREYWRKFGLIDEMFKRYEFGDTLKLKIYEARNK